jgi:hypothetical protein
LTDRTGATTTATAALPTTSESNAAVISLAGYASTSRSS